MAVSFYLGACTQGKEHRYSIRDIGLNLNRRVLEVFVKFLRPNQTQVYTGEPKIRVIFKEIDSMSC